jgi:hypothetical protein
MPLFCLTSDDDFSLRSMHNTKACFEASKERKNYLPGISFQELNRRNIPTPIICSQLKKRLMIMRPFKSKIFGLHVAPEDPNSGNISFRAAGVLHKVS